uniref:PDZ domain-containing protein n=1 Tax=Parascaris univalens TaxID=6257 RepID=A0A915BP83_PARUN
MKFACRCTARHSLASTSSFSDNVKCDGDGQVVSASTSAAYLSRSGSEAQKALDARSNKRLNKERSTSPKGAVNVRLTRIAGVQLGLGIAGGSDRAFPPTISFLRPGFIAHRCDHLQVGERLTHVNGIPVDGLTHDQVLALLRNAGTDVQLRVEYDLNNRCFNRPQHTMSKCTDIVLEKERGSFGLTLRGGAYGPDRSKSRPITVTNIRIGGPAHREGRLRVGDRVLCINGVDVYSATLAVAQRLLEESLNSATVTIEYDVPVLESVRKASGALMVEIDKAAGSDLGVMLKINDVDPARNTQRSIIIDSITPASTADRCGALHCGDEILSVDGIGLEYTTLAEARQLLRGQAPTVRLEILPLSQMHANENGKSAMKGHLEKKVRAISHAYSRKASNNGTVSVCFSPPAIRRRNLQQPRAKSHERSLLASNETAVDSECEVNATCASRQRLTTKGAIGGSVPNMHEETTAQKLLSAPSTSRSCCKFRANDLHNGNSSMHGSMSTVPSGQVCHCETMEVVLQSYAKGAFGLVLQRQQNLSTDMRTPMPLFISYIEKGSPAERCGVLQVGDRVLTINDWYTANGTIDEANRLMRHSSSPLTLTVEFDVIESLLPPNGILNVKLAKRGNNLGIIARGETDGRKGEPVIISDIRTGSVAQRCGSIHVGDRILAIDNIPLDSFTVEEAMRLLQRSGDVVKLRIRKASASPVTILSMMLLGC